MIYELVVVPNSRLSAPNKRSLKRNLSLYGIKHLDGTSAIRVAEVLSALPAVQRVTIIQIQETPVGVWRKGKKS